MFHQWMSAGDETSSCLACGIEVADGYLFREDMERKIVIGLSVDLPDCTPAEPSCATHYINDSGECEWCGIAPKNNTCQGHETCMYCM